MLSLSRRALSCLIAVGAMAASGAASAQEQPREQRPRAVLELFTSQGCSSCPAADALFVRLARDPELIVLTLPVDYWDYLGWRDTLAHAAFSTRQRRYAKARGDGQIYTPQAVVDGAAHTVGSDREAIERLVAQRPEPRLPLGVAVRRKGDMVSVTVSGQAGAAQGSVWIAPVARERSVAIQRGENKGREVTYANVVRALTRVGDWRGQDLTIDLPASLTATSDSDGFVVLVQADEGRPGRILGAARGPAP